MDTHDDIIAIGLLTQNDIQRLGDSFSRLFPLPRDGAFDDLIKAIDDADREKDKRPNP